MGEASDACTAPKRSKRWLFAVGIVLAALLIWVLPWIIFAVRVATGLGFLGESGGITISEETTRITEPIGDDGSVDYLRALNERSREGVTPENNAAVLLWQAFGPAEAVSTCGEEGCDWLFKELGVPRPPAEGEYFVPLFDYGKQKQAAGPPPRDEESGGLELGEEGQDRLNWHSILRDQESQAGERPWSKEEFPELAHWLEVNDAPLQLVVEASKRQRLYTPLVPSGHPPPVISSRMPGLYLGRECCTALRIRAMLRLKEGNVEQAWQDVLACHRLARLTGEGPTLIHALVAFGMEWGACAGDAAVAHHGELTAERAKRFQADLRGLAPLPNVVDKTDVAERFTFLDSISAIDRDGLAAFVDVDGASEKETPFQKRLAKRTSNALLDCDEILRMGNAFYDRLVETARTADRLERADAVEDLIEQDLEEARRSFALKSAAKSLLSQGPRDTATQTMGRALLALIVPNLPQDLQAEDGALMITEMSAVALALAAYRADHGGYPERLEQLVPEYLEEVPDDVFTGAQLRYESKGQEYLLYSVGPNREDEEGRTRDSEPQGDDIVIRTTLPEAQDD